MRKIKQIRIGYYKNSKITKEIALAESCLTRGLETYLGKKFEDGETTDIIIKAILRENMAKKNLTQDMTIIKENGEAEKYVFLITSASMQKKEESEVEVNVLGEEEKVTYKCEAIFIKEEYKEFVDIFLNVLSLGKIGEFKKEEKEIGLIKDIVSRIGLTTSYSTNTTNPKILLMEELEYNYLEENMKYLEINKKVDKNKEEYIDSSCMEFKDITEPLKYTFSDGQGLMSIEFSKQLEKDLEHNSKIDICMFRDYRGLMGKGTLIRFNFKKYIKDFAFKNRNNLANTTLSVRNNKVYIKDIVGREWDIEEIDVIYNTSMSKWSKWHKNDIKALMEEREKFFKNELYSKYKDSVSSFSISKVNKSNKQLKDYCRLSYQLLTQLSLTKEDIEELAREDLENLEKLLQLDINQLRLRSKEFAEESQLETSEDGEVIEKKICSVVGVLLQQLKEKALNIKSIRAYLAEVIKSDLLKALGGKITVNGGTGYRYSCIDPLNIVDSYIFNKVVPNPNTVKNDEIVVNNLIDKNVIITRFPVESFLGVVKSKVVYKEHLKDYCNEMVFSSGTSNFLNQLGGSDLDGDKLLVSTNKILYNSVIVPDFTFINQEDTKNTVLHKFNAENLAEDIITSSGDFIGKIALTNVLVNQQCQTLDNFYTTSLDNIDIYYINNNKVNTMQELQQVFWNNKYSNKTLNIANCISKFKQEWAKLTNKELIGEIDLEEDKELRNNQLRQFRIAFNAAFNKYKEGLIISNKITLISQLPQHLQKASMDKTYNSKLKDLCFAICLQQKAIDIAKTLQPLDSTRLNYFNTFKKEKDFRGRAVTKKHGTYLKYSGKDKISIRDCNNALDSLIVANRSKWKDINTIKKDTKLLNERGVIKAAISKNNSFLDNKNGFKAIKDLYTKWLVEKEKVRELEEGKKAKYKEINLEYNKKFNTAVKELELENKDLTKEEFINKICSSLVLVDATNKFLIDVAFSIVEVKLKIEDAEGEIFVENVEGEYRYNYKNYSKVKAIKNNTTIDLELQKINCKKANLYIRTSKINVPNVGDITTLKDNVIVREDLEEVGKIFDFNKETTVLEEDKEYRIFNLVVNAKSLGMYLEEI